MEKLSNLQKVNTSVLPTQVLILMSKYAKAIKSLNGTVVKLSSLDAFNNIDNSFNKTTDENLREIYQQLLEQVNLHISTGSMSINKEKKITANNNNERVLTAYLPNAQAVA